jgi:hypothetical protein
MTKARFFLNGKESERTAEAAWFSTVRVIIFRPADGGFEAVFMENRTGLSPTGTAKYPARLSASRRRPD